MDGGQLDEPAASMVTGARDYVKYLNCLCDWILQYFAYKVSRSGDGFAALSIGI